MLYLVTYDLLTPGQNYQALYDTLKGWGAKRVLLSTWVLRGENLSVAKMRDALMESIDTNDRLLITRMSETEWATYRSLFDINNI